MKFVFFLILTSSLLFLVLNQPEAKDHTPSRKPIPQIPRPVPKPTPVPPPPAPRPECPPVVVTDPVGDIDQSLNFCSRRDTDVVKIEYKRDVQKGMEIVTFELATKVDISSGYKEFYFWLDVTGDNKGYRPYDPDSVAWPGFYADYRVFVAYDVNPFSGAEKRVALQDCRITDCSNDLGLYPNWNISEKVEGNKVTIWWPLTLIPELLTAKKFRIGYTTYYQMGACHGEDDAPQWGEKSFLYTPDLAVCFPSK
ncbi:MAG: hypothetical protein AB7I27_10165 [Bacteriovoracaceae bacterium]